MVLCRPSVFRFAKSPNRSPTQTSVHSPSARRARSTRARRSRRAYRARTPSRTTRVAADSRARASRARRDPASPGTENASSRRPRTVRTKTNMQEIYERQYIASRAAALRVLAQNNGMLTSALPQTLGSWSALQGDVEAALAKVRRSDRTTPLCLSNVVASFVYPNHRSDARAGDARRDARADVPTPHRLLRRCTRRCRRSSSRRRRRRAFGRRLTGARSRTRTTRTPPGSAPRRSNGKKDVKSPKHTKRHFSRSGGEVIRARCVSGGHLAGTETKANASAADVILTRGSRERGRRARECARVCARDLTTDDSFFLFRVIARWGDEKADETS